MTSGSHFFSQNISKLVQYVVCYATEHDIALTTLRLVKFLYLADLYYARAMNGKTLTGFPWAFVTYGPYCREAYVAIEHAASTALIEERRVNSQYANADEYHLYTCREEITDSLRGAIPDEVRRHLNEAIRRLGDDTPALLDYVYFATEPMEGVKKGDKLDFSKSRPTEHIVLPQPARLSGSEITEAKTRAKALSARMKIAKQQIVDDEAEAGKWKDELYYRNLGQMEEDELKPGVWGTADIVDASPADIPY